MKKQDFVWILTHHETPEHGWIEVPQLLIEQLQLEDSISEYSYYSFDKKIFYLEDDADASLFIKTAKKHGVEFVIRDKYHKNRSFITCGRYGEE